MSGFRWTGAVSQLTKRRWFGLNDVVADRPVRIMG
jgi:hypothetical protein